ncbi:MAG: type II toxin-antitoxin system RelE/ParE family toxin [Pseudomonadota bacterium]
MSRSIHRLAALDLEEAAQYYYRQGGAVLARRFLSEFERIATLLEQHPGLGSPSGDGRQVFALNDFPYSVVYRAEAAGIRILVVRHQRRHPAHGQFRQ